MTGRDTADLVVLYCAALLALAAGLYSAGAGYRLGTGLSGVLFGGILGYTRGRSRGRR